MSVNGESEETTALDFDDLLDAYDTEEEGSQSNVEGGVSVTAPTADKTPPLAQVGSELHNHESLPQDEVIPDKKADAEIVDRQNEEDKDDSIQMLSAYAEESFGEEASDGRNLNGSHEKGEEKTEAVQLSNSDENATSVSQSHDSNADTTLETKNDNFTPEEGKQPNKTGQDTEPNSEKPAQTTSTDEKTEESENSIEKKPAELTENDAVTKDDGFELSVDDSDMGSLCIDLNDGASQDSNQDNLEPIEDDSVAKSSPDPVTLTPPSSKPLQQNTSSDSIELSVVSHAKEVPISISPNKSNNTGSKVQVPAVDDGMSLSSINPTTLNTNQKDAFEDVWDLDSNPEDANKLDDEAEKTSGEKQASAISSSTALAKIDSISDKGIDSISNKAEDSNSVPILKQITDVNESSNNADTPTSEILSKDADEIQVSSVKTGASKRKRKEPVKSSKFEPMQIKEEKIDNGYDKADLNLNALQALNNMAFTDMNVLRPGQKQGPLPGTSLLTGNRPDRPGRPPYRVLPNTARIVGPESLAMNQRPVHFQGPMSQIPRRPPPPPHPVPPPRLVWNPNLNRLVLMPHSSASTSFATAPANITNGGMHNNVHLQSPMLPPNVQVMPSPNNIIGAPPGSGTQGPVVLPVSMAGLRPQGNLLLAGSQDMRPPITVVPNTRPTAGVGKKTSSSVVLHVNSSLSTSRPITLLNSNALQLNAGSPAHNAGKVAIASNKSTGKSPGNAAVNMSPHIVSKDNRHSNSLESRGHIGVYVPKSPPAKLGLGDNWSKPQYTCKECGDSFLFKSSLRNHLERRSMLVNFYCQPCKKKLAFVNKCACLNHRLLHKQDPKEFVDTAVISVLPKHMMPEPMHKKLPDNVQHGQKADKSSDSNSQNKSVEIAEADKGQKENKGSKEDDVVLVEDESPEKRKETPSDVEPALFEVGSKLELVERLKARPEVLRMELRVDAPRRCPECKKMIGSQQLMGKHFRKRNKNWQTRYRCKRCSVLLPNACSYSAHNRIHDKLEPYVCPQCGEMVTADRDVFMKHIKFKCMHFYHRYTVACPTCKKDFTLGVQLENHMIAEHTDKYNKCLLCPMAFRTDASFTKHWLEKHEAEKEEEKKTIYKCPCCAQIMNSADSVSSHLQKMIADETEKAGVGLNSSYHCPYCSQVFHMLIQFRKHLMEKHAVFIVDELCGKCGVEFKTSKDLMIHQMLEHTNAPQRYITKAFLCQKCKQGYRTADELHNHITTAHSNMCSKCMLDFSSDSSLELHMKVSHSKTCPNCQMKVVEGAPFEAHMKKHAFVARKRKQLLQLKNELAESREGSPASTSSQGSKPPKRMKFPDVGKNTTEKEFHGQVPTAPPPKPKYPCSECGQKFAERDHLKSHMQEEHQILPMFPCHLCSNTYTDKDKLERHVKVFHEGKTSQLPFMCFICQEKHIELGFNKRGKLEKHLLLVHKIHKNNIDYSRLLPPKIEKEDDDSRDSADVVKADEPVRKLRVSGDSCFTCAKCTFQCEERESFIKHIVLHRSDSECQQCQECGLCFSVFPSLKRHLFMVHKVRDFTQYKNNTGIGLKADSSEESPVKKRKEFEKVVCSPVKVNGTVAHRDECDVEEEKKERKRSRKEEEIEVDCLENLTCNVCYKNFDEASTLRKHMRTHGMAFIKSKRNKMPQWFDE